MLVVPSNWENNVYTWNSHFQGCILKKVFHGKYCPYLFYPRKLKGMALRETLSITT